jgi:hypothetical protein
MLKGKKVPGPVSLVEEYPRVKESIIPGGQSELF